MIDTGVLSNDLFTRATPQSKLGRLVQFPLIRIVIAVVFLIPSLLLHRLTNDLVTSFAGETMPWLVYVEPLVMLIFVVLSYILYARLIEKRPALELSSPGLLKESGIGFGIGLGLITAIVAVLFIAGYYRFGMINKPLDLVGGLLFFISPAFVEELLFRVILFKLIEEFSGSYSAITVIAALFGLAHLANDGATLYAAVAIMLETGLLLGLAFMLTRRIWFVWGIHLGWNYAQGSIFGLGVSGVARDGLFKPAVTGPSWLTGGEFGVEASVIAVLVSLIIGYWLLRLALKKGKLVKPVWRRKEQYPAKPTSGAAY